MRRSFTLKKWSEFKINNLSSVGAGIARTDNGIIFINGALPGEIVQAEIISRKKDFSIAKLIKVLQESNGRIIPKCKYYGKCGGCQLQHADYNLQLELKINLVRDAMTRLGGFDKNLFENLTCEPSPEIWNYRNKAAFPVQNLRGKICAGFYKYGTHELEFIKNCPVNAKNLNFMLKDILPELNNLNLDGYNEREHKGKLRHLILRTGINTNEKLLSLVLNGKLSGKNIKNLISRLQNSEADTITINHNSKPGNTILGNYTENLTGSGFISEMLDDFKYKIDTTSFFQVNTHQAENLFKYVAQNSYSAKNILELYSGVGSLTCYLAKNSNVTSIEEWKSAVNMARKNLKANNLNVNALCGKSEDVINDLENKNFDLVVLDPPRDGCDRIIPEVINKSGIKKIIYVSCNPATLARDCKIFSGHDYKLISIKSFDMFPQTVHVETVAVLLK